MQSTLIVLLDSREELPLNPIYPESDNASASVNNTLQTFRERKQIHFTRYVISSASNYSLNQYSELVRNISIFSLQHEVDLIDSFLDRRWHTSLGRVPRPTSLCRLSFPFHPQVFLYLSISFYSVTP